MGQNRRISDHFDGERLSHVDLLPVLRAQGASEPVHFLDDPYTNRIGHQVIVEAVVGAFEPELTTLARDLGCLRD